MFIDHYNNIEISFWISILNKNVINTNDAMHTE